MIERRISKLEVRSDGPMSISGYAATWNTLSEKLGNGFRERLLPGCFTASLKSTRDVRALFNHDPNGILGRKKNGTLTLAEDSHGLKFRCMLPDTSLARDVYKLIQRNYLGDCSFAFEPDSDGELWDECVDPDNPDERIARRTLRSCKLFDISVVGSPAYQNTSVEADSINPLNLNSVSIGYVAARNNFPEGMSVEMRSRVDASNRNNSRARESRNRAINFILSL